MKKKVFKKIHKELDIKEWFSRIEKLGPDPNQPTRKGTTTGRLKIIGSAKTQWFFWCLLPKLTRYSLTLLLSAVLLSDAVGATPRNQGLQIAQQPETTPQNATRAAAKQVFEEGIQLDQQGTAESLRQAIGKYQEALKLWQTKNYALLTLPQSNTTTTSTPIC